MCMKLLVFLYTMIQLLINCIEEKWGLSFSDIEGVDNLFYV
jgi:hypothetical protein